MGKDEIQARIKSREAKVAVIGAGYVGMPLAVSIAEAGFQVVAIDRDAEKVRMLNAGESYIGNIESSKLAAMVNAGKLSASTDFSVLADVDCISVCVPTPLNKTKDPDVSYILAASREIAKYLKSGALVVLESTTYPGTTREAVLPMLCGDGRAAGEDFFLCFSPERVDPGNETWTIDNTPKVIGGVTTGCTDVGREFYSHFIKEVVPVSSTESAEMVKLLENTFRAVNIALVNEVALMCQRLGLDSWEVIDAAATKPFGFMPFYPGPGLGGHCIPIDPLYLSWKLKTLNYNARFIALASEVNSQMPDHVVQMVGEALNDRSKPIRGSKILLLGVAYKKDVSDLRESPALDIMRVLASKGADISYHDPFVPSLNAASGELQSVDLTPEALGQADCVIVTTFHTVFEPAKIVEASQLIIDTRNITRGLPKSEKVVRL